jgi:hypothetical protein
LYHRCPAVCREDVKRRVIMVPKVLQHKDDNKALEPPPVQVPLRNVEKEKPKILEDKKQEDEIGDDTEI